ncbi:MAG: succinylglutamate desuccinylase/aspartoacylase family protein [Caldilineaceae bacterium]|nr:succinylglutamate desuccinylase/aspartoacylase family protein [Caldilineaceae bacterium]
MHISDLDLTNLERGTKSASWLNLSQRVEGGWWQLPLLTVTGSEPGPTLVVTAGVHGDEYEGVEAIPRIAEQVNPHQLRGTLLMVPVCNMAAYATATRNSPIDGLNLARVFPGSQTGTLTEQIAYWLTHKFLSAADFFIDLHSAGIVGDIPTLAGYVHSDDEVGRRSLAAARVFGAPVLWGHPPPIPPGRSITAALDLGVPCLYTEAAGAGRARPEDVDCFTQGVLNVMHHLDMLAGEPAAAPPAEHLLGDGNMDEVMSAPMAGYFRPSVQLLQEVQSGQLVGTIHDPLGTLLAQLHAESDGIVIMRRGVHRVLAGDGLIHLTNRAE